MSGTVLVGVDGSAASRHALDWACLFAARSGLGVRAVMAWQPNDEDTTEISGPTADLVMAHLTEVVADVGCESLELLVVQGHAAIALVAAASDPEVVLLVIGRRGLGTVPDLLLGSVARSLLHAPPCPVVLVPPPPEEGWRDPSVIVMAIDGGEMSSPVVALTCRLADTMDVKPTVVRCIDVGAEFSSERLAEVVNRTRAEVEDKWCAPLMDANSVFVVDVRNAEARRGIMAAVEASGAGMLVVGLHGAGQFRGIGGTTSYLARHVAAPLVVVPPDGPPPSHIGYRL